MKIASRSSLITAYTALATIVVGLAIYDSMQTKPAGPLVGAITLESVAKEQRTDEGADAPVPNRRLAALSPNERAASSR